MLWHIAERAAWEAAPDRAYVPEGYARDGFIHLSTDAQWPLTLRRFYATRAPGELVLLAIDVARLDAAALRYEPADGDHFPHLYGPLPRDAVIEVRPL